MAYTRQQELLEVAQCFSEGLTQEQIAEELNITPHKVKTEIAELRNKYPEVYEKASSKLSKNQNLRKVLICFSKGLSQKETSEKINISVTTVQRDLAFLKEKFPEYYEKALVKRNHIQGKENLEN